jgi:transcriptional regulator with XRE-family HTH domain
MSRFGSALSLTLRHLLLRKEITSGVPLYQYLSHIVCNIDFVYRFIDIANTRAAGLEETIARAKSMMIGKRLRSLREEKGMSQGDVEKCTGLLRCYISRIENGHTTPSLETLERFAGALEIPLHRIFYPSESELATASQRPQAVLDEPVAQPGVVGDDARFLLQLRHILAKLGKPDRDLLLTLARKLATR